MNVTPNRIAGVQVLFVNAIRYTRLRDRSMWQPCVTPVDCRVCVCATFYSLYYTLLLVCRNSIQACLYNIDGIYYTENWAILILLY